MQTLYRLYDKGWPKKSPVSKFVYSISHLNQHLIFKISVSKPHNMGGKGILGGVDTKISGAGKWQMEDE
jgi:hypothetical protein